MADTDLVAAIRQVLIDSPFHGGIPGDPDRVGRGEGYRKVWARLRHAGRRTSKERLRRLMRENGLQAATRRGRPRGSRNHDGTIILGAIDTMWGTDMTATVTVEHGQVAVFIAVDHCSAACVGIQRAPQRSAPSAKRTLSGDSGGPPSAAPATKHSSQSDRASPNASAGSRRTRPQASPSVTTPPRPPGPVSSGDRIKGLLAFDGNGCAERFIRTLEENLLWVRTFQTVEERRLALIDFRQIYNESWLIERHGHRSPAPFRRDQMDKLPLAA
jgi:putative transposase